MLTLVFLCLLSVSFVNSYSACAQIPYCTGNVAAPHGNAQPSSAYGINADATWSVDSPVSVYLLGSGRYFTGFWLWADSTGRRNCGAWNGTGTTSAGANGTCGSHICQTTAMYTNQIWLTWTPDSNCSGTVVISGTIIENITYTWTVASPQMEQIFNPTPQPTPGTPAPTTPSPTSEPSPTPETSGSDTPKSTYAQSGMSDQTSGGSKCQFTIAIIVITAVLLL